MICKCTCTKDNDAILDGMVNITSIKDLYLSLSNKELTKIIMTEEFVLEYFTHAGIQEFIDNVEQLLPHVVIEAPTYKSLISEDISYLSNVSSVEDLLDYVLNNNKQAVKLINHVFQSYEYLENESIETSHRLNNLCAELAEHLDNYTLLKNKNDEAEATINKLKTQLDTLITRINYTYSKNMTVEEILGQKLNTQSYNRILYFKEHIRVHYIDTFIYYLQMIMKVVHGIPVRFVVMEPLNAYGRAYLYSNCKSGRLSYEDIDREDIFLAGYSPKVMERVLANPSHVEFLIILDRTGWKAPYVSGNNVKLYHIVPDIETLKIKPADDVVFSYSKETQHVPYIDGFDNMSHEKQLSAYSNMKSMQALIKVLREGV